MTENDDLLAKIGQLAGELPTLSLSSQHVAHSALLQAKSTDIKLRLPSLISLPPISRTTCLVIHTLTQDGHLILEAEVEADLRLIAIAPSF